jgi:hypothetical protein
MPTIDLPDDELNASAAKHVLVCASIWFTRFLPCRERRSASRRQPSRVPDALTAGRAKSATWRFFHRERPTPSRVWSLTRT